MRFNTQENARRATIGPRTPATAQRDSIHGVHCPGKWKTNSTSVGFRQRLGSTGDAEKSYPSVVLTTEQLQEGQG